MKHKHEVLLRTGLLYEGIRIGAPAEICLKHKVIQCSRKAYIVQALVAKPRVAALDLMASHVVEASRKLRIRRLYRRGLITQAYLRAAAYLVSQRYVGRNGIVPAADIIVADAVPAKDIVRKLIPRAYRQAKPAHGPAPCGKQGG